MYMLYFLRPFFSKALLDVSVYYRSNARIGFQNCIIAIKLYHAMILIYKRSDFGSALKCNNYNINSSNQ